MSHPPPLVRSLVPEDWPAVQAIFEEGLATGHATLETEAPDWRTWDAGHHSAPRLVAMRSACIAGWAATSPVSRRPVYRGVAELSIYIAAAHRGQGVGTALLEALIPASEVTASGPCRPPYWQRTGPVSALHQRAGFRIVGTRERLGARAGVWRDSVLLERRSRVVG